MEIPLRLALGVRLSKTNALEESPNAASQLHLIHRLRRHLLLKGKAHVSAVRYLVCRKKVPMLPWSELNELLWSILGGGRQRAAPNCSRAVHCLNLPQKKCLREQFCGTVRETFPDGCYLTIGTMTFPTLQNFHLAILGGDCVVSPV